MYKKGNQLWKLADYSERTNILLPEDLKKLSIEYFEWCDEHPIKKMDFKGKDATKVHYELARPYTIQGLCIYCNIASKTFYNYEVQDEYIQIVTHIRQIIYSQKFEGAAVGIFNPNIIARDLGLVEKKELDIKTEQPLFPKDK